MNYLTFAPAGNYDVSKFHLSVNKLSNAGLHLEEFPSHDASFRFAGTDNDRFVELVGVFEAVVPLAIACRGGYGVVRLLNSLDSAEKQLFYPKWIAGYSDITALHCWIHKRLGWPTIHSTMMTGWLNTQDEDISVFKLLVKNEEVEVLVKADGNENVLGNAKGRLLGGNLSVLHGLVGTPWFPNLDGAILFIEDIAEPWYKIDRMLWTLAHGGHLSKLQALIVGDFSQMLLNDMGLSFKELIVEKLPKNCPVFFGFPAGHEHHHIPIRLNADVEIQISESNLKMSFAKITFP